RLRDREVAGVGAGARHDVTREFRARFGHAERVETREQRRQLFLGEAPQREVLTVRDADLDAEVALDLRETTELLDRDIAEAGVRVRADRAVGAPAHDVGRVPPRERGEVAELDGRAGRTGGDVTPEA